MTVHWIPADRCCCRKFWRRYWTRLKALFSSRRQDIWCHATFVLQVLMAHLLVVWEKMKFSLKLSLICDRFECVTYRGRTGLTFWRHQSYSLLDWQVLLREHSSCFVYSWHDEPSAKFILANLVYHGSIGFIAVCQTRDYNHVYTESSETVLLKISQMRGQSVLPL